MERQLRQGGGIMDVVPREAALFGGLKKAIKKVTKTVKNVAKSPVGKAAMLYFAPMAFGQSAPGLAGYQGLFSQASPAFSNLFKAKKATDKISGAQKAINALKVGSAVGGLSGLLAAAEQGDEEAIEATTNVESLRRYLYSSYENLGYDPAEIPDLVERDVSEYTAGQGGYATGGRVNFNRGSLGQRFRNYLARTPTTPQAAPAPAPKQPAPTKPKPTPFDMSKYGQGTFTGGIEDTRNIALARLMGLGYDTSRFADPMGPPPGSSSGPMLIGPGMAAKFKDEENLAKLINPSYGMKLQTDVVGLLSMAKDIGENYTIDQALDFDEDDAMRIMDAYDKKNKYGKYAPRSSANILPKFPGTTTTSTPDYRGATGSAGRGINYAIGGRVGYAEGTDDEGIKSIIIPKKPKFQNEKDLEKTSPGLARGELGEPLPGRNESSVRLNKLMKMYDNFKMAMPGMSDKGASRDLFKNRLREEYEKLHFLDKEKFDDFLRQNKAKGGRIGYAMGDSAEDNAMQAAGIMNLPLNRNKAGVTELDLRKTGGFIPPVGIKEKADDIPAMLSNNEFVFTADAVRGMGDGNVNLGAQRMYDMMKKLENGGRV